MTIETVNNVDRLIQQVQNTMSLKITLKTIEEVLTDDFIYYVNTPAEVGFQEWYFETVTNTQRFLSDNNFFREFRAQYRLHTNDQFLGCLAKARVRILQLISDDDLKTLYHEYFEQAQTGNVVPTDQKVFFTKLVHTFRPTDYCVMDHDVSDFLGLENEDILVAFYVVSRAYKEWSSENSTLIQELRNVVAQLDKDKLFRDSMTDLKLLDLIFLREGRKLREARALRKHNRKTRGEVCPNCHKVKRDIRHVGRNTARAYTCVACHETIRIGDADKWFSCKVKDGALPDGTVSGVDYAMFHEECEITIPWVCQCEERVRNNNPGIPA